MTTYFRTRLPALTIVLVSLLAGCTSTPPVIPHKPAEPFSLVPVNFLRTGISAGLVASSSRILVIASSRDDSWTAYDLPSLARRTGGRLPALRALAIHPDGGSFLALSDGGLVTLVSLADGQQAPVIAANLPAGRLPATAISSDAAFAVARPPWGQSRLYDLASAKATPLDLPGSEVRFVSIAPDGTLLTGSRGSGSVIQRSPSGALSAIPLSGSPVSAAWHRDYVACGSLFWEFRVWPRTEPGKAIVRTIDHTPVSALAFGQIENRIFLFAGSGRVGGGRIRAYGIPQCNELAALSPDCGEIIHLSVFGTTLVAVSGDGMAALWTIHPGTPVGTGHNATNRPATNTAAQSGIRTPAQFR